MPYFMNEIYQALDSCDIFISIGTSGNVYPAAGFAAYTKARRKIEINVLNTEISAHFSEHRVGLASLEVPPLVEELIATQKSSS